MLSRGRTSDVAVADSGWLDKVRAVLYLGRYLPGPATLRISLGREAGSGKRWIKDPACSQPTSYAQIYCRVRTER